MYDTSLSSNVEDKIYFVPNSTFFNDLMETFRLKAEIQDERVQGFSTEAEVWSRMDELGSRSFIIIFNGTEHQNHLSYKIRSKSNKFRTDQQYSKDLPSIHNMNSNEYIDYGFLAIQHALDKLYYEAIKGEPLNYEVELERIQSPQQTPIQSRLHDAGLYIIIFSSIFCISLIFTRMIEEKSCGFREQLKNATPFSFLNNVALFTTNHLQLLFLLYFCLIITFIKSFWFSVNVFYPIVLMILFATALISFTFLVSAFFESSKFLCSLT